jgi:hypothetical protein
MPSAQRLEPFINRAEARHSPGSERDLLGADSECHGQERKQNHEYTAKGVIIHFPLWSGGWRQ